MRLDQLLATMDGIVSRGQAQRLLKSGQILLNEQLQHSASKKVQAGQKLKITIPDPTETTVQAQAGDLNILYEDRDLLVINKDAGMVVHPAAGHEDGTLVNFLLHHCGDLSGIGGVQRPGIVHRLDKDTSGILVIAKNDFAHQHLASQFEKHTVIRQYQALVWGKPQEEVGVIDVPLIRHPVRRKEMTVQKIDPDAPETSQSRQGKRAVTHWRVLKRFDFSTQIACRLETGRTHQIRVHLTSIGHSLIGDQIYGKSPLNRLSGISPELKQTISNFKRQALHAEMLGFLHPVSGEKMRFQTPIPEDFKNLLDHLS